MGHAMYSNDDFDASQRDDARRFTMKALVISVVLLLAMLMVTATCF